MNDEIREHYRAPGLPGQIRTAFGKFAAVGRPWSVADLAPLDQFHFGGLAATAELASLCELTEHSRVLDLGSGLGGPARYLATVFGCRVEGIDSSADFVESARELASQTGLDERVRFDQGHVCHLPYRAGHFDVVWTQHVSMNVADRVRLYGEIARVLRPGGIFAAFEPVATDRSPPDFPLPWARTPQSSFLVTETRMRELILATEAFDVISWRERSGPDLGWMAARERSQISTNRLIPTALAAVLGADFPLMLRNFIDALDSRRVALVQAVLRRRRASDVGLA